MRTAAIYARYSSDLQSDASIEDQVRLCREHAEREGLTVVECYSDHGISGATLLRPGVQALLQDTITGKYDVVIAEALDRLSRDQEDIAHIYKRLTFADTTLVTLSEGKISELHIGLKGTMSALFLKDLADKTRRGQRGRVEKGKSGGGNSYGYDVVRQVSEDGLPIRGDRRINDRDASIIRRIFNEYAAGASPRTIARTLNEEHVPGPSGKGWGPSTIHGNPVRGTGILNNELYIGRLVWNRLRYVKDPETGKRISKLNPKEDWVIIETPQSRIIDQGLWDAVKTRQESMKASRFGKGKPAFWDRRRPKFLFSGLMRCSVCGGGVVNFNKERVGCANARNKGTCDNKSTIRRDVLEATVLDGLQHHLMEPHLVERFCEHYARHANKAAAEHNAGRTSDIAELQQIERDMERLVQAILDGVPGSQVKDKMAALEERKAILQSRVDLSEEQPVLMHPNMGKVYRDQVAQLREALTDEDHREKAVEVMRGLIDSIDLIPVEEGGKKTLAVSLRGKLAAILALGAGIKKPLEESGLEMRVTKLVAGVGFEPTTFRL